MNLPKVAAVLFTGKTYSNGTHPIMVRITKDRKHTYKSIGHAIPPEAWDNENNMVYEKKPAVNKRQEGHLNTEKLLALKERYKNAIILTNAKHINSVIVDTISEINNINQKLKVNDEDFDIITIRSKIKPSKEANRASDFLLFGKDMSEKFMKGNSIGTYKRYKSILNKLKDYIKRNELKFSDISPRFLETYEAHLHSQGYKINTIHNNLKTIRAIYYAALKEGIIKNSENPFFIFKLKLDKNVKKQKLTVDEIKAIETLQLDAGGLLWHVRNCFLLSFYCAGIRISDMLQLKWKNITKEGRLDYQMEKTGGQKSISLIPKAKQILEHYKLPTSKPTDFIFPFIDKEADITKPAVLFNQISAKTALVNKYLKKIAELAEIEKPLSTHIARHSFSDIARKRKASIYDISKMLGHSSIKITEAYLASLDLDSQDETLNNVMDF
jgi:integrase/recombinase XerD